MTWHAPALEELTAYLCLGPEVGEKSCLSSDPLLGVVCLSRHLCPFAAVV